MLYVHVFLIQVDMVPVNNACMCYIFYMATYC